MSHVFDAHGREPVENLDEKQRSEQDQHAQVELFAENRQCQARVHDRHFGILNQLLKF